MLAIQLEEQSAELLVVLQGCWASSQLMLRGGIAAPVAARGRRSRSRRARIWCGICIVEREGGREGCSCD